VNVSKDNFLFAAAAHIPALMNQFEREVLSCWTPCRFPAREEITRAMAETHVELVLIHPFRDGNGRLARVVSTLMALQAGLPLLDFRVLAEEKKQAYVVAIHSGMEKRYDPMQRLFEEIIEQSLSAASQPDHSLRLG
jgi:cell filamentation protein